MLKVLFIASEAYPFAKTGGLADVVGALPKSFGTDVDVRVMIPNYGSIPDLLEKSIHYHHHFYVQMNGKDYYCGILTGEYEGVKYYFIDNEYFFRRPELYGYYDDGERFTFFSRAALESLSSLGFEPDILHCHDWETAAIPYLLKHQYRTAFPKLKTVFTIHNMKYQGIYGFEDINQFLHLGFLPDDMEFYGKLNLMKGALYASDLVTTVSPTYAHELKDPYYGEGLEGVIRSIGPKEIGILNGIDGNVYNPATDSALFVPFSEPNGNKAANKKDLQEYLNLPVRPDVPMIAMINRLIEQKGLDLIANVIHEILQLDIQFVVLGTGDIHYEKLLSSVAYNYPDKMVTRIEFDDPLSRRIYAASDLFLMPSKFEPCGLSQMIAMRYGSVPIVRETGGLKDTVSQFDPNTSIGNGFTFLNYNAHDMLFTIQNAVNIYHTDHDMFEKITENAFYSRFNWENSAQVYLSHYRNLKEAEYHELYT
ncbi:glycogen synthase GlgA [Eubacteriaceae bacterium ES2]|nr:glycogen synthase GlgA [Eubacteriaceae bacterium ES2]